MPEFPEFTQGQYGKLTAEVMNSLVSQVQQNTEFINNFGLSVTTQPRGGAGNFPIVARLTKKITQDEGTTGLFRGGSGDGDDSDGDGKGEGDNPGFQKGYEWREVWLGAEEWETRAGREYSAEQKNPAIPTNGLRETTQDPRKEEDSSDFTGMIVFLHPFASQDGKPILVFQSPGLGKVTPLMIVGSDNAQCDSISGGGTEYQVRRFNGTTSFGEVFTARNGTEIVRGGNLGGSLADAECQIDATPTAIPEGTIVLGVLNEQDETWIFSLTNERCVTCCNDPDEGVTETSVETGMNQTAIANRETVTKTYEPLHGSMYLEMMR
jgi:hypothetical protein